MKEKTFWLETVDIPAPAPHEFPQRVDVAVIGAGFTGLSAARSLARGGASVAAFEAQTIGWGASPPNAGIVLPGPKIPPGRLISPSVPQPTPPTYAAPLAS